MNTTDLHRGGVDALFAAQAARIPDALAVICGGEALTYRQLDQQAWRLAWRLRGMGVGPDVVVAVGVERSLEMAVAVLGVLKAGGAYLPLDPEYPPARLEFMIADARAPVLLTQSRMASRFPAGGARVVLLDEGGEQAPHEQALPATSADALAYVIYTSGSTGNPKGVAMPHGALVNLLRWQQTQSAMGVGNRTLQFTPLSFDVSFQECFATWSTGGTLVLIRDEERLDPVRLAAFLQRERIERLFMPFIALQQLAEAVERGAPAPTGLKEIITAGEQLQVNRHVVALFSALPGCSLVNQYGPSETHVVTAYRLAGAPPAWPALPPIGEAIANVQAHILDEARKPVAVGGSGELFIGGAALARGYLHRPELTAERFVTDPAGNRLYRTGDLVRQMPDGNIEFLGRIDSQVKLRGYRIELGEVEVALGAHADIKTVVAAVREDAPGDRRLVAYFTSARNPPPGASELRRHLGARVPDYMIPSTFVAVEKLPLTPSGKVDRRALPAPAGQRPELDSIFVEPATDTEQTLASVWRKVLKLDQVGVQDNFFDLGGNSLLCLQAIAELRASHGHDLPVVRFFQHPTIAGLARFLDHGPAGSALHDVRARAREAARRGGAEADGVAIVGMAGKFPGAENIAEFWKNIADGVESITVFADGDLHATVDGALRRNPQYVKARGVLAGAEQFDAAFFGIAPREAELMDPQQRVFLETCWQALEDAGYDAATYAGLIGVFAGMGNNTYYPGHVMAHPELVERVGAFQAMVGNEKDYIATRVGHRMNLKGPCVSVHTACSTSLVAVGLAFQSLRTGQCDIVLAGGCSIATPQNSGYLYQEGGMLSRDGHCRPFDAQATGTIFSNGVGVVVLKRLRDALRDGDEIWAVIRGAGINNDGADKVSFSAPSVEGQAGAIVMAQAQAGVEPETISYVEAHGTATPLGDPIEIEALTAAFRTGTARTGFCAIGSVKGNVGHLIAAAGVAGLIKTVMAMRHKMLPPSLFFENPNPAIDFAHSPFVVNRTLAPWPEGATLRRAGVSSFGVGGTNAHVIVEEAPAAAPSGASRPRQLLLLSARTDAALAVATQNLLAHLEKHPEATLADVAFTLQTGRRAFAQRRAVICRDVADALRALEALEPTRAVTRVSRGRTPDVVFMFPGQGTQYVNMGLGLYRDEPVFRDAFDRCANLLMAEFGLDLKAAVYPGDKTDVASAQLRETGFTQPALFAVEYALALLWQSWGVEPAAMIGHSIGEFVCACLAGVFSLEDALRLVATRGRLMQALPPGAMLSVRQPAAVVAKRLGVECAIAAINGPALCVASGPEGSIQTLETALTAEGVACKRLLTSHAFHSPMMDPILAPFGAVVRKVAFAPPRIPFVSTVTATWITTAQATDPEYWTRHLREPVRFAEGARVLWEAPGRVLLEVGPGTTAATLARQQAKEPASEVAVSSLGMAGNPDGEWDALLLALGQLWTAGVAVHWDGFYAREQRRRVSLPTYPFERKRCWIEPGRVVSESTPLEGSVGASLATAAGADEQRPYMAGSGTTSEGGTRRDRLIPVLRQLLEDASGFDLAGAPATATFLELGMDSLFLTQIALTLQKRFGVAVTFRQLLEQIATLGVLADFIDQHLPAGVALEAARAAAPVALVPEGMPEVPVRKPFGAAARITLSGDRELSPAQQACLKEFVERYTRRTAGSKKLAQDHRRHLADPRVVSGFRPAVKEIVYPIAVNRSSGSHLWDVDGNDYVDLTCGFGSNFFGNQAPFIAEALAKQLQAGVEIGPQNPLAGEVAGMMTAFTGLDRVAFCNTGSEAVLGALRVARTVTGRDKIAMFVDDYHGTFDEVILRPGRGGGALPAAAGIPRSHVENVLMLEYGADASLEILRAQGQELAAILVEPVQSRHPDKQPKAFLQECRRIADACGAALIMDEVITGFRVHPGGAQAVFGVQGDLATYGKVVGAGMPIGVIAGRARFMDALDGGFWQFGDGSAPEVGVTYFAGTFVRHPLALAAAKAALTYMREQGPELQRGLNDRTEALVRELNGIFVGAGAPYRIHNFGSLFKILYPDNTPNADLLFFWLRSKGIHIWDARPCFLTIAHSEGDLVKISAAFRESVAELQAAGFWEAPRPLDFARDRQSGAATEVPATEAQQEIWASVQMGDDANCAYNESVSLTLRGMLDVRSLREALALTIQRHEALRMTFSADGRMLHVALALEIDVPALDWSGLAEEARAGKLAEHLKRDVETPFDLERGPLVRAAILRLGLDEWRLVLTVHHIVCDGWAIDVVVRDLAEFYAGRCVGVTPNLGHADGFSAYAGELAQQVDSAEMAAHEDFWIKQFADGAPELDFPTDRPRPTLRSFDAARLDVPLAPVLVEAVKRVAADSGCTFVSVMLAAFEVWLHRLSGQDDIVVGLPAAGQSVVGAAGLVGHCVSLLPLRSRVAWDEPFRTYARRTRGILLDAYDHQAITFGRLVRRLKLTRDASRIPLVPIVFNIDQGIPLDTLDFAGLKLEFVANPRRYENFEMFVNLSPRGGGSFVFECTFNTNLFDEDTIGRRMAGLMAMLEGITRDPGQAVGVLPVMAAAERERVLVEWNSTGLDYERGTALHRLFEQQVAKTPGVEALCVGTERVSYAELNRAANRLAHRLQRLGVGPDVLVGVCLERRVTLIVALLGVLKAGGAYVAMDPAYPKDRLAYILSDSGARIVVTEKAVGEKVTAEGVRIVAMDDAAQALDKESEGNPVSEVGADRLAYVLYTSGSTGKPKGVAIEHRGPLALLAWARRVYTAEELSGVLAATSVCFDLSVFEIFLPLTTGGRVILADNATALPTLPAAGEVTLVNTVPSAIAELLRENGLPASVQTVNLAGEVLTPALADAVYARAHVRKVYDLYGPTEDTTYSTWTLRRQGGPETIGRPIANTSAYVLDARREPVPIGVPGELYLGGEGLARGYLHRDELTAERFVVNPIAGATHARLYRSGDQARFTVDGNLEYMGRLDRQVKLRGFRIELGEIEAVLQTQAAVAQSAVLVREDTPGDPLLVAYVVPRQAGALPTATELRRFLRAWLPDFMIPQFFVELEKLPMTPNGKIDRKALPAPRRAGAAREAVEPRTDAEKMVAAVWREVLKVERVGIRDNFFDLGGHSLLAIQAVARLHVEAGVRLSPRVLMFNTIEQIAPMLGGG